MDERLYAFFAAKLERQIADFGKAEMERSVRQLADLNSIVKEVCVEGKWKRRDLFDDFHVR